MHKVLVANRSEIAVRVIRAARELGISSVAICSEADENAMHAREADETVVIGPAAANKSYLVPEAILDAARKTQADAVHPGYGFMSERPEFAQAVVDAGLIWVGPDSAAIAEMGDKARAIQVARDSGVPTIPGSDGPVADVDQAREIAVTAGFPVAVKAAAGGGGKGIRVVANEQELLEQLPIAQAEALSAFGNSDVYIERMVTGAKHIEVQIFGDGDHFVHLGERECSVQRRRQKLIEETPAPKLPENIRQEVCAAAVRLAESVRYRGAGTVEFLYEPDSQKFFFIEMNTRIQVEHPITEAVTGFDLVAEQLKVAAGKPLSVSQEDIQFRGHAIEVRLNAENPDFQFMPSPGTLEKFLLPSGPFVRVDSGFQQGDTVTPFYDSLLAKVIVWGRDRPEAIARILRALSEVEAVGVATTSEFLASVIRSPEFESGDYDTLFLETWNGS